MRPCRTTAVSPNHLSSRATLPPNSGEGLSSASSSSETDDDDSAYAPGLAALQDALTPANVAGGVDVAKKNGMPVLLCGCTSKCGGTSQRISRGGTSTARRYSSPAWDSRRSRSNQAYSDSRSNASGLIDSSQSTSSSTSSTTPWRPGSNFPSFLEKDAERTFSAETGTKGDNRAHVVLRE